MMGTALSAASLLLVLVPQVQDSELSVSRLVQNVVDGSEPAASGSILILETRGPEILKPLIEAHLASQAGKKPHPALADLIFRLKLSLADENTRALFKQLDQHPFPPGEIVIAAGDYLRKLPGKPVFLLLLESPPDPFKPPVESGTKARQFLDGYCLDRELDYDIRYGIVVIAGPPVLWGDPAPIPRLSEKDAERAREWIRRLEKDELDAREEVKSAIVKLGRAVIPLLIEGARSTNAEVATVCEDLMGEVAPRRRLPGSIPVSESNHWRRQTLEGLDQARATDLTKCVLMGSSKQPAEIFRDTLEERTLVDARALKLASKTRSWGRFDYRLDYLLENVTLAMGLDVRIEHGLVIVYHPANFSPPGTGVPAKKNAWESQALESRKEKDVADKLRKGRISLETDALGLEKLLKSISDQLGIAVSFPKDLSPDPFLVNVKDVDASWFLGYLTLNHGLDARIESGGVVVFEVPRPGSK